MVIHDSVSYLRHTSNSMVYGTVFRKLDNPKKGYKSTKVTSEFIMVIKMHDGHYFDMTVTPTTFSLFEEGQGIAFNNIYKGIVYNDYTTVSKWLFLSCCIMVIVTVVLLIFFVADS